MTPPIPYCYRCGEAVAPKHRGAAIVRVFPREGVDLSGYSLQHLCDECDTELAVWLGDREEQL